MKRSEILGISAQWIRIMFQISHNLSNSETIYNAEVLQGATVAMLKS